LYLATFGDRGALHVREVEVPELTGSATVKLNAYLSLRRDVGSVTYPHGRSIEATAYCAGLGGQGMSKREKEASNMFRPSDRPLTEYEEEQKALRKNLERLKAERLAR
jgi:hypothetical protein